jgi:hypothetical protein
MLCTTSNSLDNRLKPGEKQALCPLPLTHGRFSGRFGLAAAAGQVCSYSSYLVSSIGALGCELGAAW